MADSVERFERAVEAVVDGDVATLTRLLDDDPELVHARSTRVTDSDPPVHGATLLHFVADALCDLYGSRCTTMALLVSSTPPARAGVQVPVLNVRAGVRIHGCRAGAGRARRAG